MKTYKRIAAVKTANVILKHLASSKEPVGGADIAKATGIKEGTVMCHLATLEDDGFVERIGDRFIAGRQLAFIWARVKSSLEAARAKIDSDLDALNPDNYRNI